MTTAETRSTAHWLTRYDPDDGEPYGQICHCGIADDHDAAGNVMQVVPADGGREQGHDELIEDVRWALIPALVTAGYVTGRFDEDGYVEDYDVAAADRLIDAAIRSLATEQPRAVPPGMAGSIVSHLGEVLPKLRPAVLADIPGAPTGDLREGAGVLREYAREIEGVARICEDAAAPARAPEPGTGDLGTWKPEVVTAVDALRGLDWTGFDPASLDDLADIAAAVVSALNPGPDFADVLPPAED